MNRRLHAVSVQVIGTHDASSVHVLAETRRMSAACDGHA